MGDETTPSTYPGDQGDREAANPPPPPLIITPTTHYSPKLRVIRNSQIIPSSGTGQTLARQATVIGRSPLQWSSALHQIGCGTSGSIG